MYNLSSILIHLMQFQLLQNFFIKLFHTEVVYINITIAGDS
jgi:hypothetical protein